MTSTKSLLYALVPVALVTYYLVSSIRAYRRLSQFKGPWLAGWSDAWYISTVVTGKCHLHLSDVSTKYGPLARIGPNTLLTCDEEYFRRIHSSRSGYYRADWYKAFRFGADVENVFSVIDNDRHTYLRKRVQGGYSGKDNPELEKVIDGVIFSMFTSWRERYVSNGSVTKPMDLARQMAYLTLDIITALSFSEPFGWVSSDSDLYEYVSTMAANFPVMFFTSAIPVLSDILRAQWVQRLLAPSVKDRVGMGKIKAVSNKIIADRFTEFEAGKLSETKQDMTTSFISQKMTLNEISDNALLAILAGSDTSATTIRSGLAFMLTQPRIMRKLQAECDGADIPYNQIIPYTRAVELPYLQACVKESLRCFPVASGLAPRVVPPKGDSFNGQFIPGGTIIGTCTWNMFRLNADVFGPDTNLFRPERWIEAAAEAAQAEGNPARLNWMDRVVDLVFSAGEFKCLGYRVALIEVSKVMFELARRFDLGFIDGMHPFDVNVNYGLFVQEGMWVKVEEREF